MIAAMDGYKIITGSFEGPLDLLMHLIEKDKLDIYDIPIAEVTEQYMAYIDGMKEFDIEIASEFLLMAAILLQIKSRLLLPKQILPAGEIEDTETDPRQELIDRLVAYKQFKILGDIFTQLWQKNTLYAVRTPMSLVASQASPKNLQVEQLMLAISELLPDSEQLVTYIEQEEINVQDKIDDILALLVAKQGKATLSETLTRSGGIGELVSAFLAVLELLRLGKIKIEQPEKFGTIYLYIQEEADVL